MVGEESPRYWTREQEEKISKDYNILREKLLCPKCDVEVKKRRMTGEEDGLSKDAVKKGVFYLELKCEECGKRSILCYRQNQ